MDVLAPMTGLASRWRITPRLARLVARLADDIAMGATKGKIGLTVIEGRHVEMNDIGFAARMLAMTAIAFALGNRRDAPVETLADIDVATDLLVTVEAEPALALLFEAQMALLAVLFVLGMTDNELARQQDRIEDTRLASSDRQQGTDDQEPEQATS